MKSIRQLLFFPTYRCNLRCSFCLSFNGYWRADAGFPFAAASGQSELSTEDVERHVIMEAVAAEVEHMTLSGGEVLMRTDAKEIFSALASHGVRWSLDSNMMMCDRATAASIVTSGCEAVFVSIDGTAEVHNELRRCRHAYQKAMEGVGNLLDACRHTATGLSPRVVANCVVQPGNEACLEDVVLLCAGRGISGVTFQLLSFHGSQCGIDIAVASSSIRYALARGRSEGVATHVFPLSDPDMWTEWFTSGMRRTNGIPCGYLETRTRVDPYGNVIPCIECNMGNVREEGLRDIWQGSEYERFRRHIRTQPAPSNCRRCCNFRVEQAQHTIL